MQLLKQGRYVYLAHLGTSPMALSIIDVADPSDPRVVNQMPHAPNTHAHKVQIAGDILIQNQERPYFDRNLPASTPNEAGIKIYSIEKPTEPREIGCLKLPGKGVHRMWFTDGKYAHVGAMLPGIKERAYLIADIADPSNPKEAGRWWIPGTKEGEETPPDWTPFRGRAFSRAWRDSARRSLLCRAGRRRDGDSRYFRYRQPKTISHIDWSPPFGGYAHTTLPLPGRKLVVAVDESVKYDCNEGEKRVWLIDIREERNPVIVSTLSRAGGRLL